MAEQKKNFFQIVTGKIETVEDALYTIKQTAYGAYAIAAVQGIIGFFLVGPFALIDAGIYALCGFFIQKFQSKIAAVAFFLFSSFALYNTFTGEGGRNYVLAIIVVVIAFTAMRATVTYEQLKKKQS